MAANRTHTSDPASWPALQLENEIEFLEHLGESPLAMRSTDPALGWVITGIFDNTYNGLFRARLAGPDADAAIEAALQQFRAAIVPVPSDWREDDASLPPEMPVPYQWYVAPADTPPDVAERLKVRGCGRIHGGVGMAMTLSSSTRSDPPDGGVEIRRVETEADLAAWTGIYDSDERERKLMQALLASLGLGSDRPMVHFQAAWNGQPAGTASAFLGSAAMGIYHVKVIREARNKGIGSALTRACLNLGISRGYPIAVLAPSPEGKNMYQRLGFKIYDWPFESFTWSGKESGS